ncbi:MAG: ribosome biogenesis GTP-binding protein YihA/YsxC [Proteobacteria bacterium]|nr:ribosome biogenesis GTP-binding protein YihA/YsxC [Pseudomonadota bacterium]
MKTIYLTSAARADQLPKTILPEFAFFGRSNVGKSSLLNALLSHTGLARTSRTPGRTQMANFFVVNDAWQFADLPGYGFSKTPNKDTAAWQELMDAYIARPQIKRMLFLWDPRRELDKVDYGLLAALSDHAPVIFVMTKCDKLNRSETQTKTQFFTSALTSRGIRLDAVFAVSSLKKIGIVDLREHLFHVKS